MSVERIGRFQLLEELGRGGMGVVFRGYDPKMSRPVAIKIIHTTAFASAAEKAEAEMRFEREAAAAGSLSHPHIVTVHDLGSHEEMQYLVMELVDGVSLEKKLTAGQAADPKFTLSILTQVADALDYAHGKGVVHRDVKPGNILVRADGQVKITDFGIARIASRKVTRTGVTFGTPSYMSPDQMMSAAVDGRADQWSLAVIAYRMLCGKLPFEAETEVALTFKIVQEEAPPADAVNRALPKGAAEAIAKAMAKKPEGRFATCREFVDRLAEAWKPVAPPAPVPVPSPREAETRTVTTIRTVEEGGQKKPVGKTRRAGMWVAVGVAAVALGVGGWAIWKPNAAGDKAPPGTTATRPKTSDTKVNGPDGLTYVWIGPGTFQMGCSGEKECGFDERPAHEVRLTSGFWIGQTEVTQDAYVKVTRKSNPSQYKGPHRPVENVSWTNARDYCKAAGMRLPTEAEWEYAARAGNTTAYYGELDRIAWYDKNGGYQTHDVQGKDPNAWKLYDMLGNVWEWVADWYGAYPPGSVTNPTGPEKGTGRSLRGGAFYVPATYSRVSVRGHDVPGVLSESSGFRCAGN